MYLLELHEYLKSLKTKASLSNSDLAQKSGVSIANLSRILSGENDNPSWQTLVPLFRVLNGSMDAAAGIHQDEVENMASVAGALQQRVNDQKEIIDNQQRIFDYRIQDYEKRLADKDRVLAERQTILERQISEMKQTCDDRMDTQKKFYDVRLDEHKKQLERERNQIDLYRSEMNRMRKVDTALSVALAVAVVVALYILLDAFNGAWGFIVY